MHKPINATKANDDGEKLVYFRWIKTVVGNLKTANAGTLKSVARPLCNLGLDGLSEQGARRGAMGSR